MELDANYKSERMKSPWNKTMTQTQEKKTKQRRDNTSQKMGEVTVERDNEPNGMKRGKDIECQAMTP